MRHGTVLGLVGAGGIGLYIDTYLKLYEYDSVMALLIVIFAVVVVIDLVSMGIRSFVTDEGDVKRPTWRNMIAQSLERPRNHHLRKSSESKVVIRLRLIPRYFYKIFIIF